MAAHIKNSKKCSMFENKEKLALGTLFDEHPYCANCDILLFFFLQTNVQYKYICLKNINNIQ